MKTPPQSTVPQIGAPYLHIRLLAAVARFVFVGFTYHATAAAPPNARYWGTSINPGSLTNAQILALSNDRATEADTAIITNIEGDVAKYVYYAYPTRFGDLQAVFFDYNHGFNILAAFIKSTQTVSPVGGPAELYNVYRSDTVTYPGSYRIGFFCTCLLNSQAATGAARPIRVH